MLRTNLNELQRLIGYENDHYPHRYAIDHKDQSGAIRLSNGIASFGKNQCIGTKVAPVGNRLFVPFPNHEPFLYALTEIKNGQLIPYPDAKFQSRFVNVQDLWRDERNQLWVLDSKPGANGQFALYDFDLAKNKLLRVYTFDDLDRSKSALNDVRVDHLHGLAYLSDPGLCPS
ncbi:L-dopachrome tautomerase-related protein [Mucilaginibacter sp. CAU 1740]|uniref:L-dopachrome tautomerase-related protein n=1 Tax=Mucilaginibacter sp. CAU 1740 TaxID=3140365 RepID=UPI00325AFB61